jgi:hypothetical protein
MKKNVFAAIIWGNEAEAFLPDDFFDCARHTIVSPVGGYRTIDILRIDQ